MQRLADVVGDGGVSRGSELGYAVPAQRVEFEAVRAHLEDSSGRLND